MADRLILRRRSFVRALVLALGVSVVPQMHAQGDAPQEWVAPDGKLSLSDAVSGQAALTRLGTALPGVAAQHGVTGIDLAERLARESTLWLTGDNKLVYVDIPAPERFQRNEPGSYAGGIPTSEAFLLHTNPGADQVIYLDFDGHHSKNNGWGHNIVFPAWNNSGSSSTFTTGELQSIINHWLYVAEDFSSWNVDVTTEEPPEDDITKKFIGDQRFGVRCVMTQVTSGFGSGSGGIAILGSFGSLQDTPVFGFNKGDNTGSMTASHEVGHALSLSHDGLNGSEYHPGTGSGATGWGPIMGAPFGQTVVHWSKGDYAGSTTTQLDASIIAGSSNGMDYWPDDFGSTVATASPLPLSCPTVNFSSFAGLITTDLDVDAWRFNTSGGTVTVTADPFAPYPNLDISLALYTGAGALLQTNNPTSATNASISTSLAAGEYVITLEGVGKSGSYSDYGSRGQYVLTVSAPYSSSVSVLGGALAGTGGLTPVLTGTGIACEGNTVSSTLSQAKPNASAWLVFGIGQINLPFKGGVLIPNTSAGGFLPVNTGPSGGLSLPTSWPAGVPSGLALAFQYWIQDAGGPAGFAASNGLEIVAP